ncbi:MAG: ABC transporter permease [Candidatus Rokubacteria bacterium]|nr:ABC transporter permease [Candidatus Rokubacteria bacterium]
MVGILGRVRPARLRALWPRGYSFAIAGIAVGIAGLVALGALAERISRFIEGGHRFVLGQISVAGAGIGSGAGFTAGGLLPRRALEAIVRVPGVQVVQAQVMVPVDPRSSQLFTVNQELVLGLDLGVPMPNRNYPTLPVARGRFLERADRGRVVVGADFAAARGLRIGDRLRLGDKDLEVVGILERLLTAPDRFAFVSLDDARELWLGLDPTLRALFAPGGPVAREDLNTGAAVGWAPGVDPGALATRIGRAVPGVHVAPPGEVARQLAASTAFFTWLLVGVGTIGLLIGGLSLSNTVAASTFERIRDFGIKQALGATDLRLFGEVLRESLVVSLSGGIVGTALALAAGTAVDARAAHAGQQLFLFSGRLLGFAVGFAAVLGAIAAAYATARILRVPPAEAVRRGA